MALTLEARLKNGKIRLDYWIRKCAPEQSPTKLELEQLKRAQENVAKLERELATTAATTEARR